LNPLLGEPGLDLEAALPRQPSSCALTAERNSCASANIRDLSPTDPRSHCSEVRAFSSSSTICTTGDAGVRAGSRPAICIGAACA